MSFHVSARQKDKALGSITEVVQTVKHPQSHIRTISHDATTNKIHIRTMSHDATNKIEEHEKFNLDYALPISAESENKSTPGRQTPQVDYKVDVSRTSSVQEDGKSSRKSGRNSLMG